MDSSARYRRRGDVIYRIVDDEAVVVRTDASEVLGVNAVGARILDLLDGEVTVDALIDRIEDEYDVERSALERDVRAFLRELVDGGVLEPVR